MCLTRELLQVHGPYDLEASLRVAASFAPASLEHTDCLHFAARAGGSVVAIEVAQTQKTPPVLSVSWRDSSKVSEVVPVAAWVVFADLDLRPFYRIARTHPVLGPIARTFRGVKPLRPASLFEMTVVAITEQQISLAAAYAIRSRVIEKFGDPIDGLFAFPPPARLADATLPQLRACGLSRQKVDYIRSIARAVCDGTIDFDAIAALRDEDALDALMSIRGLGRWSAEYILVRGMARPDRVPADDLAVRSVVGKYLGKGGRASTTEVLRHLAPFAPYRGLAAFYLLAAERATRKTRFARQMH